MSNDGQFKNEKSLDNPLFRKVVVDTTAFMEQKLLERKLRFTPPTNVREQTCGVIPATPVSLYSDHLSKTYVGINMITH